PCNVVARVAVPEDMTAGNKYLHSSARRRAYRLQINTAVDFDAEIHSLGSPHGGQLADLLQRAGNELLPSETRIDGHDQHEIHNVEHFAERLHRSRRIDDHSDQRAVAANQLQRAVQVAANLLMDRNPVCPRIDEGGNILIRILDHQVTVER